MEPHKPDQFAVDLAKLVGRRVVSVKALTGWFNLSYGAEITFDDGSFLRFTEGGDSGTMRSPEPYAGDKSLRIGPAPRVPTEADWRAEVDAEKARLQAEDEAQK